MSFSDDWKRERDQKRLERDLKQRARVLATPVARGEVYRLGEQQMLHLASLALAMEALEDILVGAGVLDPGELMDTMQLMAESKAEQAQAAQAAAEAQPNSTLIASV